MKNSMIELTSKEVECVSGGTELVGAAVLAFGYGAIALGSYLYAKYIINRAKKIK